MGHVATESYIHRPHEILRTSQPLHDVTEPGTDRSQALAYFARTPSMRAVSISSALFRANGPLNFISALVIIFRLRFLGYVAPRACFRGCVYFGHFFGAALWASFQGLCQSWAGIPEFTEPMTWQERGCDFGLDASEGCGPSFGLAQAPVITDYVAFAARIPEMTEPAERVEVRL